jgi:hypothetical protein
MSLSKAELAVGTLGSLPACDGQNGACRDGALAMASVRGRFTGPGVPERCGLSKYVLYARASARVCMLRTVIEKRWGLGPLKWRDHDGGQGERGRHGGLLWLQGGEVWPWRVSAVQVEQQRRCNQSSSPFPVSSSGSVLSYRTIRVYLVQKFCCPVAAHGHAT